eukprot:CAMPEP_0202911596 /NCGR_PEP_ID=MMETSP1392-20130828/55434_1 /ASSEMBLY_ACC=CAM_ASM_000868 /TAXON_ID=225041 /ORGANISM="Chlamydomonas chlamydogama, Strain SAG 11-48b" /LENGTH=36 /DNA_ID= /DNA_START= /DNA_END= /DNA_ORIENTATION=
MCCTPSDQNQMDSGMGKGLIDGSSGSGCCSVQPPHC